jgi:hypothetical protein
MDATERNNVQRRRSVAAVVDQLPRTLNQRPLSECGASAQCFIRSLARCHGQAPVHNPCATRSNKMLSLCSCSCSCRLVPCDAKQKMSTDIFCAAGPAPPTVVAARSLTGEMRGRLQCGPVSETPVHRSLAFHTQWLTGTDCCNRSFAHWRDALTSFISSGG